MVLAYISSVSRTLLFGPPAADPWLGSYFTSATTKKGDQTVRRSGRIAKNAAAAAVFDDDDHASSTQAACAHRRTESATTNTGGSRTNQQSNDDIDEAGLCDQFMAVLKVTDGEVTTTDVTRTSPMPKAGRYVDMVNAKKGLTPVKRSVRGDSPRIRE